MDAWRLDLSSFSTQHAQRCVPARSVVTQYGLLSKESCACIFLKRRNALATSRPKTERMHFSRFTNRLLQLVLLNSCLNYFCLRNCLRPERSPLPLAWGQARPMPEAAENAPAADSSLSRSSSSSCSEAPVAEDDLVTGKNAFVLF